MATATSAVSDLPPRETSLLARRLRVRVDLVGARADFRGDPARLLRLLHLLLRDPLALHRLLSVRVRLLTKLLRLLAPLRLLAAAFHAQRDQPEDDQQRNGGQVGSVPDGSHLHQFSKRV